MRIEIKKIKEQAKKDFEKTWLETSAQFELPPQEKFTFEQKQGKEHILPKTVNNLRSILLEMGFDEVENMTIIPEEDVYRQYGPEAAVILDRAFYIAKLPRPEIGLDDTMIAKIKNIAKDIKIDTLKDILREYKKGNIEGDDFTEELVTKLDIKTEQATAIIDLFGQLKNLTAEPTKQTFRSHMTGTWYHTLAAMQDKHEYPITLFSIGRRYRNEQKEDAGHLRVHNSASIAIMDPNIDMIAGRRIVKKIFQKIGFKKTKFETKKATSKYYANRVEDEVYVMHNGEWLEIADMGMYSQISLANFNIKYPVFNVGFGVERLAMVLEGHKDIRQMIYPQFYSEETMTDAQIAKDVKYIDAPKTDDGKEIAQAIVKAALSHKDDIAPASVPVWRGAINGKEIQVSLTEREEGKKLIGPAAFNKIFVKDNNIINSLDDGVGEKTGMTYIGAIANKAASDIESKKEQDYELYTGMVKNLGSINLEIPAATKKYMESNNKKADIKGPVFVTITAKVCD